MTRPRFSPWREALRGMLSRDCAASWTLLVLGGVAMWAWLPALETVWDRAGLVGFGLLCTSLNGLIWAGRVQWELACFMNDKPKSFE